MKLLVELFRQAYVRIVPSRINSLLLRFIRSGTFFRPGKKHLFADSLKALEKGYDRVLKSCRRYKEKTASALSRVRPHFSRGDDAVDNDGGEPPCCRKLFRIFLYIHTRNYEHICIHIHALMIIAVTVLQANVYYIQVEITFNCEWLFDITIGWCVLYKFRNFCIYRD